MATDTYRGPPDCCNPEVGWELLGLPNPQQYPIYTLPKALRNLISDVCNKTKAPVEMVAASMLSSMSLVTQASVDVMRPSDGAALPTSLFMVTLAESGERKTACFELLLEGVREWEAEQGDTYRGEVLAHEAAVDVWRIKKIALEKKLRKAVQTEVSDSEITDELNRHFKTKPLKPKRKSLISSDVTPEALIQRLHDSYQVGGLYASEGAAIMDGRAFRDLPLLNSLWDGQPIRCDRKDRPDLHLNQARCCVGITVQPSVFDEFLQKAGRQARGNGFFARCLFTRVISSQGNRSESGKERNLYTALPRFHDMQKRLLSESFEKMANPTLKHVRRQMHLSKQAAQYWLDYFNQVESQQRPGGQLCAYKDAASKLADNALRIAASLALFSEKHEIDLALIGVAASIADFHFTAFRKQFEVVDSVASLDKDAQELLHWMRNNQSRFPYPMNETLLKQYGPNRLRSPGMIGSVLAHLVAKNEICCFFHEKKKYYQLNFVPSL